MNNLPVEFKTQIIIRNTLTEYFSIKFTHITKQNTGPIEFKTLKKYS